MTTKLMRSRLALTVGIVVILGAGLWASDLFQTLAGTVSPPGYVAADRWGYQTAEKVRVNFNTLNTYVKGGSGTPESAVTGGVGATFQRTDGACGTSLYVKESGSGNTGWRAVPCNNLSNQFFTVSGPASSLKTFTFPNASATVLTDNALVTVAQGGHGAAPGGDDQVFVSSSSSAGAWKTISDCAGANQAISYTQSSNTFGCSSITGGGGGGVGTVTNTGSLTSGTFVVGNGSSDIKASTSEVLPGANGGGLVRLSQIVTSSSQATVDFTSISGSYTALKVIYQSRDTASGTASSVIRMRINNDSTTGDYTDSQRIASQNGVSTVSSVAIASLGGYVGSQPNDGVTAGMAAVGEVTINNYAGSTWLKRIIATNAWEDNSNPFIGLIEFRWLTTAITRLTFTTGGTAFKDNSVFTLYGMN